MDTNDLIFGLVDLILFYPVIPLAITGLLALWGFFVWRRTAIVLTAVWIMLAMQAAILWAWIAQYTAAAAFRAHPVDSGMKVIPPQLEAYAMSAFWCLTAALLLSLMLIVIVRRQRNARSFPWAYLWLAVELFMFVCVAFNLSNFRRMPNHRFNIGSISPNGLTEVRIVPMNCDIHIKGIVLIRSKGEFFWHPFCYAGDLTFSGPAAIEWSKDSAEFTITSEGNQEPIIPRRRIDQQQSQRGE